MKVKTTESWSLPKQKLLRRVLQSDPTQEYFMYLPSTSGPESRVCVLVHGMSRDPMNLVKRFRQLSEIQGVVLVAPHFTTTRHADYQRMGRDGKGIRADLTLNAVIDEVAWLTGASTQQVYMFGHSGGAQFTHRYAMAYPQRVAKAAILSAGWYTLPDVRARFPYGMRPSKRLRSVRFDLEEFLRVPITLFIGSEDITSGGVRRGKRVDAQGPTRLERARNWVAAMKAAAEACHLESMVTLQEIEAGGHSFKRLMSRHQLGERIFEALFGMPLRQPAGDAPKEL